MRLCIIRHTIYDLKGYGLCRERHCLRAVPLLILQKNPLLFRSPAFHAGYVVGKVGDFVLFALVLSKLLSCKSKCDTLFSLPM
nr:MAG TPA: hypothetical protein [Caudoviricetes sp.]